MLKATTKHGAHYLIDEENQKALRVKSDGGNHILGDGEWFNYVYFCSYDRKRGAYGDNSIVEIGKSLYFEMYRNPNHDYQISTDVVELEIV